MSWPGRRIGSSNSCSVRTRDSEQSRRTGATAPTPRGQVGPVQLAADDLRVGSKVQGVSFELHAGEVLGLVALEGQGQDELFEVLAGARRQDGGTLLVGGRPRRFGHPADAIAAGLVYVPADRVEALLMQRSVRENIALPASARVRRWGLIDMRPRSAPGAGGHRSSGDRYARPGRGSATVRRQSAEGHHRPLDREWRPNDAVLRPDPGHRHPHQTARSTCSSESSRTVVRPCCCTPRSSTRSASSATGQSSCTRVGSWRRWPLETPTSAR